MFEADARTWATVVNLAAVAGFVLSGGTLSIIAILLIWLIYRERSALIDFHGKQQTNAAITLLVVTIAAVVGTFATLFIGGIVFIPLLAAYGLYVLVVSILAAVAAHRGEYYRMPLIIRFIR